MTFTFPRINLRRTYLIARRDFVGYVKTWGFWLTTFGPFIGLLFLFFGSLAVVKSEPTTYAMIYDETGIHASTIEDMIEQKLGLGSLPALDQISEMSTDEKQREQFEKAMEMNSARRGGDQRMLGRNLVFLSTPSNNIDDLKKYVTGEIPTQFEGKEVALNGVLHIYDRQDELVVEYWTTHPNNNIVENLVNSYFSELAQNSYMDTAGLSLKGLAQARSGATSVQKFNPEKIVTDEGGQEVTFRDSLPYFIAAVLSLMLWLTIFTGAYMLLVSMVEEKINKVLEMLLATTRFSEIFVGKLLGVAALTLASLLPWVISGTIGIWLMLNVGGTNAAQDLLASLDMKMFLFVPVFLVLGYIFYGSMFIALGAVAESMQDASTLMTPMVLIMTACIGVVPIGLSYPDSPIVVFGQWFPFSAPFAAIVRLPADPPVWETLGSAISLILASILVIWLSSRVFQQGVLSGGGISSVKTWFTTKVLRRSLPK